MWLFIFREASGQSDRGTPEKDGQHPIRSLSLVKDRDRRAVDSGHGPRHSRNDSSRSEVPLSEMMERKSDARIIGPGIREGFSMANKGITNKANPNPTDACKADPMTMMRVHKIISNALNSRFPIDDR